MHGLQSELGGQVIFYTYDVDNPGNQGVAQQYGIRAIPTTIILDQHGNIVRQFVGFTGGSTLRNAIYSAMQ